ncbi:MAG: nickel-dependent hydrogenase large subunit [Clostridiales bacterium]|nr:nickel-dependent hydrogenase large subunit [Clostridiales bacterium]
MSERIVIPIGPQHPSLKEPGCFTITLEGEKVVKAVVGVGYNHRGLEKACESRTYIQDLYILERVCGICSHTHSTAFCQAVEKLAQLTIPRRADYIRSIMAELERLHSHLLWLGVAGHEIGFDTLFMYAWRDRELVLDMLAMLGGNRVNYGINTIGGVRRDITPDQSADIRKMLDVIEERDKYYVQLALSETTLAARLAGVGLLDHENALKYGAVGPVARAANVAIDIRADEPYAAYDDIPVRVITAEQGDVFGRTVVRVLEIQESINMIRFALDNLPDGPIAVASPRRVPTGEVISRTEAPRGEDVHYVRSDGTDMPDRVRVRAPSEANWHGMAHMLEGDYLADVPIIIAAIDPCYSCTDRAFTIKRDNGAKTRWDWSSLREYSIEWYKKRGVDINRLKIDKEL